MYRLTYYRYADAAVLATGRRGFDRVRNVEIGLMDFKCASVSLSDRPFNHSSTLTAKS